jgi:hypothetical protein
MMIKENIVWTRYKIEFKKEITVMSIKQIISEMNLDPNKCSW